MGGTEGTDGAYISTNYMSTAISTLREPLRALLGDWETPHEIEDVSLDAGVRACLGLRKVTGYTVTGETLESITPDLTVADLARLLYATGILFVAPERHYGHRTRELSETFGERRNFLAHLQIELHLLESGAGAGVFASYVTFMEWMALTCGGRLSTWPYLITSIPWPGVS